VLSANGVASCVTNASSKVGVGFSVGSKANGLIVSGVCVGTRTGEAGGVGEALARGVGVTYCPQSDAVPPHAASKNDSPIKRLLSRFTKRVRCQELYLYKGDSYFVELLARIRKQEKNDSYPIHLEI
jgi:hypothetical protein